MGAIQKQIKTIMTLMAIFLGIAQLSLAQVVEQNQWSLAKQEGGISVYTRKVEGYQIKQTKVETIVDLPINALYDELIDFDHHDDWMVNVSYSELLTSADSTTHIYYVEVGAPWPIMDRDLVLKGALEHMSDSLVIVSINKVDGYKVERDKFVRIPMLSGHWQFEKIDAHHTKVTNNVHGDPGGMIPGWIVNIKLVADPIESMANFLALAKKNYGILN